MKVFNLLLVTMVSAILIIYVLVALNTSIGQRISEYIIGGPTNCEKYKDLPINEAPIECIEKTLRSIKP